MYLNAEERFSVVFDPNSFPNWGYKTVKQEQLSGQEVDYSRGRGLGGTTSINFCAWIVGPKDDYDEWARLVGDDDFKWTNAKRCLDRIQNVHSEVPTPEMRKYVNPGSSHSTKGVIDISYGGPWPQDVGTIFEAAEQIGMATNTDINDGEPLGIGLGALNIFNGKRVTAARAYLPQCSSNLTVVTGAHAASIIIQDRKAIAVKTVDGRVFRARHELIVSGGALNTPQLLLLSGIGPRDELQKHDIEVVHELPMVGKNLKDHCYAALGIATKQSTSHQEPSIPPLCPTPMAFLKSSVAMASEELKELPAEVQRHLAAPTVPNFEIASVSFQSTSRNSDANKRPQGTPPQMLAYTPPPGISFIGAACILQNPQSHGTVTLASSNPLEHPIIDPKFLSHPFDRKVMIDGIRQTLCLLRAPVFANMTVDTIGPASDASDEIIWQHAKKFNGSSWHMSCTVKMGIAKEDACVDSNFKVFGLEGLRVCDLSVCPFVTK